ncbi:hypothetical protein ECG_07632 [Echinococcus granulosus]|uniref:Expressed protein n=1 Tax=Echinococcus granulosus TaxID=6210 RepID=A0A068WXI6_ECHGR|nr:hypothetical protein ECG_07632 [Echinococcus granulosus]CDS24818.1 expressed protein [Echinococcus granulosus]
MNGFLHTIGRIWGRLRPHVLDFLLAFTRVGTPESRCDRTSSTDKLISSMVNEVLIGFAASNLVDLFFRGGINAWTNVWFSNSCLLC